MTVLEFSGKTRRGCIRIVAGFVAFLGRSPATATAEDIRRFQNISSAAQQPPMMTLSYTAAPEWLLEVADKR